jgi:hypothetical protein
MKRTVRIRNVVGGFVAIGVAMPPLLGVTQQSKDLVLARSDDPAGLPVYSGSHALIVGVNKYPNLPKNVQLNYAVNDAQGIRDILVQSYGFAASDVKVLADEEATLDNIRKALKEFSNPGKVKADDRVLIYFSGHGQTLKDGKGADRGFLVPTDAKVSLEDPKLDAFERTCLPMQEVWDRVDPSPAKHIAVIADACFSGLLTKPRSIAPEYALSAYLTMPARQAITAGGKGQKTWETDQHKHGVFTFNLLQELKKRATQPQQVFSMVDLYASVLEPVTKMSKGRQMPQYSPFFTEGQMLFFSGGGSATRSGGSEDPPDDEPKAVPPGRLTVRTKPAGATVTVDGQNFGTTPFTKEIALESSRKMRLLVELPGYEPVERTVDVQSRKEAKLDLSLKKATGKTAKLTITSDPPGAKVSIDGVEKGTTPYVLQRPLKKAQPVSVRVVMDGYESEDRTATLDPAREGRVAVALKKGAGTVTPSAGAPLKLLPLGTLSTDGPIQEVRFSPDGKQAAAIGNDYGVSLYELPSGRLLRRIPQPPNTFVRLSSDWKSLVFVTLLTDGRKSWASVLVQDLTNEKSGKVLSAGLGRSTKLNYAWSDGRSAIVCGISGDGRAAVASLDLRSGKANSFGATGIVSTGVASKDGSVLAAVREGPPSATRYAASVVFLRGKEMQDQQQISMDDSDMGMAVMLSPSGDLAAVNSGLWISETRARSKGLKVFEARTGKSRFATPTRMAVGFLANGSRILGWSEEAGGTLEVFDTSTGASLGTMASPKLWVSADGRFAASQTGGTIQISSVQSAK